MKGNYEMRALIGSERLYPYKQSSQISAQTGYLGLLQGELRGDVLLTSWIGWSHKFNNRSSLANKIMKFLKEYDCYEYDNNLEDDETDADFVAKTEEKLKTAEDINGMLRTMDTYAEDNADDSSMLYEIKKLKQELGEQLEVINFKTEFDSILEQLKKYGNVLSSFDAMAEYCQERPGWLIDNFYYTFRIDTEKYSYLFRLIPAKTEFNVCCFCYTKQWLDSHIENAKKGIRFITSHYDDKFHIKDGESVIVTYGSDEKVTKVCRYIDETHLEIGTQLFHICQFAEMCEKNGYSVQPANATQIES